MFNLKVLKTANLSVFRAKRPRNYIFNTDYEYYILLSTEVLISTRYFLYSGIIKMSNVFDRIASTFFCCFFFAVFFFFEACVFVFRTLFAPILTAITFFRGNTKLSDKLDILYKRTSVRLIQPMIDR